VILEIGYKASNNLSGFQFDVNWDKIPSQCQRIVNVVGGAGDYETELAKSGFTVQFDEDTNRVLAYAEDEGSGDSWHIPSNTTAIGGTLCYVILAGNKECDDILKKTCPEYDLFSIENAKGATNDELRRPGNLWVGDHGAYLSGELDLTDLNRIVEAILGRVPIATGNFEEVDANEDAILDIVDLVAVVNGINFSDADPAVAGAYVGPGVTKPIVPVYCCPADGEECDSEVFVKKITYTATTDADGDSVYDIEMLVHYRAEDNICGVQFDVGTPLSVEADITTDFPTDADANSGLIYKKKLDDGWNHGYVYRILLYPDDTDVGFNRYEYILGATNDGGLVKFIWQDVPIWPCEEIEEGVSIEIMNTKMVSNKTLKPINDHPFAGGGYDWTGQAAAAGYPLTAADITAMAIKIANLPEYDYALDANWDGQLDIADLVAIVNKKFHDPNHANALFACTPLYLCDRANTSNCTRPNTCEDRDFNGNMYIHFGSRLDVENEAVWAGAAGVVNRLSNFDWSGGVPKGGDSGYSFTLITIQLCSEDQDVHYISDIETHISGNFDWSTKTVVVDPGDGFGAATFNNGTIAVTGGPEGSPLTDDDPTAAITADAGPLKFVQMTIVPKLSEEEYIEIREGYYSGGSWNASTLIQTTDKPYYDSAEVYPTYRSFDSTAVSSTITNYAVDVGPRSGRCYRLLTDATGVYSSGDEDDYIDWHDGKTVPAGGDVSVYTQVASPSSFQLVSCADEFMDMFEIELDVSGSLVATLDDTVGVPSYSGWSVSLTTTSDGDYLLIGQRNEAVGGYGSLEGEHVLAEIDLGEDVWTTSQINNIDDMQCPAEYPHNYCLSKEIQDLMCITSMALYQYSDEAGEGDIVASSGGEGEGDGVVLLDNGCYCGCPEEDPCNNEIFISDYDPVNGVITLSYRSCTTISGYWALIDGIDDADPPGLRNIIENDSVSEATSRNWSQFVGYGPAYQSYSGDPDRAPKRIVFGWEVYENTDNLDKDASARTAVEEYSRENTALPATSGSSSNVLTKIRVTPHTFATGIPTVRQFRLVTNETVVAPATGWDGDAYTADGLVGYEDADDVIRLVSQGATGLQYPEYDAEGDNGVLDVVDILTMYNHMRSEGVTTAGSSPLLGATSNPLALIVPTDPDSSIIDSFTSFNVLDYTTNSNIFGCGETQQGEIRLTWSQVVGATGYRIYRGDKPHEPVFLITEPTKTYWNDHNPPVVLDVGEDRKVAGTSRQQARSATRESRARATEVVESKHGCCSSNDISAISYFVVAYNERGESRTELKEGRVECCNEAPNAYNIIFNTCMNRQLESMFPVIDANSALPSTTTGEPCEPGTTDCVQLGFYVDGVRFGRVVPRQSNTGRFTYIPPLGFTGIDYIKFTVTDEFGCTDSAVVRVNVRPLAPEIVNTTARNCGFNKYGIVRVSWKPVKGVDGYRILRATTGSSAYEFVADVDGSVVSYEDTLAIADLPGNACTLDLSYTYRLLSLRQLTVDGTTVTLEGCEADTDIVSVPCCRPPACPTNMSAATAGCNSASYPSVTLSWNNPLAAVAPTPEPGAYLIMRNRMPNAADQTAFGVLDVVYRTGIAGAAMNYVDTTPDGCYGCGETNEYTYRIFSVGRNGVHSAACANLNVTVPCCVPDLICSAASYTTGKSQVINGDLNNFGYDPGGNDVSFVTSAPAALNGTLALNADGTFSYTPHPGFVGSDSFGWTVQRSVAGCAQTASCVVSIDVTVDECSEATYTICDSSVAELTDQWTDIYQDVDQVPFSLNRKGGPNIRRNCWTYSLAPEGMDPLVENENCESMISGVVQAGQAGAPAFSTKTLMVQIWPSGSVTTDVFGVLTTGSPLYTERFSITSLPYRYVIQGNESFSNESEVHVVAYLDQTGNDLSGNSPSSCDFEGKYVSTVDPSTSHVSVNISLDSKYIQREQSISWISFNIISEGFDDASPYAKAIGYETAQEACDSVQEFGVKAWFANDNGDCLEGYGPLLYNGQGCDFGFAMADGYENQWFRADGLCSDGEVETVIRIANVDTPSGPHAKIVEAYVGTDCGERGELGEECAVGGGREEITRTMYEAEIHSASGQFGASQGWASTADACNNGLGQPAQTWYIDYDGICDPCNESVVPCETDSETSLSVQVYQTNLDCSTRFEPADGYYYLAGGCGGGRPGVTILQISDGYIIRFYDGSGCPGVLSECDEPCSGKPDGGGH
jgi:hypothetical protein